MLLALCPINAKKGYFADFRLAHLKIRYFVAKSRRGPLFFPEFSHFRIQE